MVCYKKKFTEIKYNAIRFDLHSSILGEKIKKKKKKKKHFHDFSPLECGLILEISRRTEALMHTKHDSSKNTIRIITFF